MKILKSIHNTDVLKKFLIPKNNSDNCKEWVEICIDYSTNVFIAKKVIDPDFHVDWEEYDNSTFPSSLLNEFLRSS